MSLLHVGGGAAVGAGLVWWFGRIAEEDRVESLRPAMEKAEQGRGYAKSEMQRQYLTGMTDAYYHAREVLTGGRYKR